MGSSLTRPTTVAEYWERMERFQAPESLAAARSYSADADDVFIVTPSKSGTTWMQQIVHQLRTGGSMSFANINDVVPWLEMAALQGRRLDDDQGWRPHAFKTHLPLDQVPAGGRYIVVLRDPQDALLSLYRFYDGSFLEAGSIDLDEFTLGIFVREAELNAHIAALWPRRLDPDVLSLCYEDMAADLLGTVRRVADFIGVAADDGLCQTAVAHSSFAFMKAHEEKFEDSQLFDAFRGPMGLPPVGRLSKVSTGRVGGGSSLSETVRTQLDLLWREGAGSTTGLATYQEVRAALSSGGV